MIHNDYYYDYDYDDDGDDGDDDDDGDDVGRLVATMFFLSARTRIVRTDFQFYQSFNPNYPRTFCVNGSTGLLEKQHTQSHTHTPSVLFFRDKSQSKRSKIKTVFFSHSKSTSMGISRP